MPAIELTPKQSGVMKSMLLICNQEKIDYILQVAAENGQNQQEAMQLIATVLVAIVIEASPRFKTEEQPLVLAHSIIKEFGKPFLEQLGDLIDESIIAKIRKRMAGVL